MKTKKLLSLILSVIMIIGTVQFTAITASASTDAFDGEWVTIPTGDTATYTVTVTVTDSSMYGTVEADVSEASEGDTVTLTIIASSRFRQSMRKETTFP